MPVTHTLIDTTFTSKNIASAASVYEYTIPATGAYRFQVRLAAVAGNGDYVAYLTLNDGDGLADDVIAPKTTYTAAAGETSFWFATMTLDAIAGDVVNVFIDGLAGDIDEAGSIRIFAADEVDLRNILGTALSETLAGQIAAAFKKFFDVATPTGTVDSLPDAAPGAANGLHILGANAAGASYAGQVKITANVANEGALDIRNANAAGHGTLNDGGNVGLYNSGASVGQYNFGTADYGMQNTGASGQVNVGTAGDGMYVSGTDYGFHAVGVIGDTDPEICSCADAADAVWNEALAGHLGAGSTGAALNTAGGAATVFPSGAINFTYTVTDAVTTLPLEGVEVWISTDNPAVNIVWKGDTDAFGVARDVLGNLPALDVGVYFFWRQLAGYTFSDPDTETVS